MDYTQCINKNKISQHSNTIMTNLYVDMDYIGCDVWALDEEVPDPNPVRIKLGKRTFVNRFWSGCYG